MTKLIWSDVPKNSLHLIIVNLVDGADKGIDDHLRWSVHHRQIWVDQAHIFIWKYIRFSFDGTLRRAHVWNIIFLTHFDAAWMGSRPDPAVVSENFQLNTFSIFNWNILQLILPNLIVEWAGCPSSTLKGLPHCVKVNLSSSAGKDWF